MSEIVEVLRNQLYSLANILPALLKAIVVLLIGFLLAKVLSRLVRRLIEVIGLDRLANKINQVEFVQRSGFKLKVSKVLSGLVYYFVLLVFFMTAIEALGMSMISQLLKDLINYIPQAITAFAILLIGLFLADFVKKIIVGTCRSLNISAGNLIANVVFYFIFLNIILIALRQAELQTEFMENNISVILAGVAGAFAIGYGLASRDIMSNLLAAYYNRGRIQVGDVVSIDGFHGEVVQLSNNAITLRTESTDVIVPFHKLTSSGMVIHSRDGRDNELPPHEG